NYLLASQLFPATNDNVHEARLDLDAAAGTACLFCGDQRRSAAKEDIEDRVSALADVENGVDAQLHGFGRGVEFEHFVGGGTAPVGPWRDPHIVPVASVPAELDIVGPGHLAFAEE